MAGIDLDQVTSPEDKSKTQQELEVGKAKVGSEERRVIKGARKTVEGKQKQAETEEGRKRQDALIKATLKSKGEKGTGSDDEGWDSVEEDFPHIKLDDLKDLESQLAGMKIEGAGGDDDYYEEEES